MRKIYLGILAVLLLVAVVLSFVFGIDLRPIGLDFRCYSFADIDSKHTELENKVDTIKKNNELYDQKMTELQTAKSRFDQAKMEYDMLVEAAGINPVMTFVKESFYIDYLWVCIGNEANKEKLECMIDITSNNVMKVEVMGEYQGIYNFIASMESKYNFAVDELEMKKENNVVKCTFKVDDVTVFYDNVD